MKRRHRMDLSHDVPKQVAEWMDEAALTLAALPAHGLRPSGARGFWPDIVPDEEDLEWTRDSDILPPRPTPDEPPPLPDWIPKLSPPACASAFIVTGSLLSGVGVGSSAGVG